MTHENNALPDATNPWLTELHPQLQAGEEILSCVELDLDAHLHFVKSALALTNQRILARSPDNNTSGIGMPSNSCGRV